MISTTQLAIGIVLYLLYGVFLYTIPLWWPLTPDDVDGDREGTDD